MEDNTEAVMEFLKEFTSEKISPTSDDDVQIRCGIVGNYSLKPEEVDREVTDWVLNYLEPRKCPFYLAIALAKKVAQRVSTSVCKRLLQSNGENIGDESTMLQNASDLHAEAISCLRQLCHELQDHPEQAEMPEACPLRFDVSVFAIKNGRRKMEDRHVILHDLNAACNLQNAPNQSYYAVFDGHAGVETASFACAHLHNNLVQHPLFQKDTKTSIIEAFQLTDAQFSERAARENLKSGATAVCALIRESTLYIAWLGDSQAFLIKQGKPCTVMNPHKPEREDERKRIEKLGGYIYHHGTWRVNGTLAVSRALGDTEHKPFVSSEPEVNVITLDGTEDFLVIACDGLWDKMSPNEVSFNLYRHLVDNPQDADSIAAKLVHQSKLMGSNDNITTIVVFLRDIPNIIADSSKYASMFPQLEGIDVSSISQIANGTTAKDDKGMSYENVLENKYERPTFFHKDLDLSNPNSSDWSPDGQIHEIHDANGKFGAAEGLPPEQTSLSELPTPPIDEIVASKQFSEYSTSEQLKLFQEHLEAQGFHDVSLGEIHTSMTENLQFLSSEMGEDMGYLADNVQHEILGTTEVPEMPAFEGFDDIPKHFDSDQHLLNVSLSDVAEGQTVQHITHEEVLSTASDLVLNTIETAVKHVSLGDSSIEVSSAVQQNFSSNPFLKQELPIVESNLLTSDNENNPSSPKTSHQLNPNAEPFVMRKDFISFSPDSLVSSSPMHLSATVDLPLLDLSSPVPSFDDVLIDNNLSPLVSNDTVRSSDAGSPLPSAPPLEALTEGYTCSSEDYLAQPEVVSANVHNPFYLGSVQNGGGALIEASGTVGELESQPAGREPDSKPFGEKQESQFVSLDKELDIQLSHVHILENPSFSDSELADLAPSCVSVEQPSPAQESTEQPSPVQESTEQSSPVQEPTEQSLPVQESTEQPLPVQELTEQPLPVQELTLQPLPVQEPTLQPLPVQEPTLQPLPVQEPTQQPLPVQEPTQQPLPVQEPPQQPLPVQEPPQQPLPVQEPPQQPLPAQEPTQQPLPAQEPTQQPLPASELLQPLATQELVGHPLLGQLEQKTFIDQTVGLQDLLPSHEGISDPSSIDSASCALNEVVGGGLSKFSIVESVSNTENAAKVPVAVSVEAECSALSQVSHSEESNLVSESSLNQSKESVESKVLQENFGNEKASDGLVEDSSVDDVSKEVTKQVIGKDSLLPKEVQAKLLEVTSTTLASDSVTEDTPVSAVAVDLKTIPDGVPEAEGVTEDIDSDSEKDGGWSYVKATSSSQEPKKASSHSQEQKKVVDANKIPNRKVTAPSKDKKVTGKLGAMDARNRARGNVPGAVDLSKKSTSEKADKKIAEIKDKNSTYQPTFLKKDKPVTALKSTSPQTVVSKTMISDKKLMKKPIATATALRNVPSKPSTASATATTTTKHSSNITSKTTVSSRLTGMSEKFIGKPTHSSTPFRPDLQKTASSAGTTKPPTRPTSAATSPNVPSSSSTLKQSSALQKPQARASSAPLANKTQQSTKAGVTELKGNVSVATGVEAKPKLSGTTFRKPLLPPAKKPDVKEAKESTNKQILAKKTTQVSSTVTTTTQVRRTGASACAVKVDSTSKKSASTVASDTKTLKMSAGRTDVAKSNTMSKTSTTRGRMPLPSKQLPKSTKIESDKNTETKRSKNGPKKIVDAVSSNDEKCGDNRVQEANDEKGMLEVSAQEAADEKSAVASADPSSDVPASEIVDKSELKQESNIIEYPVSVTPAEDEKV